MMSKRGRLSGLCSCNASHFAFMLTLMILVITICVSYKIPMILVRTYTLGTDGTSNGTVNASILLDYEVQFEQVDWPVFDYPDGVDQLLEMAEQVKGRLGEGVEANRSIFNESTSKVFHNYTATYFFASSPVFKKCFLYKCTIFKRHIE